MDDYEKEYLIKQHEARCKCFCESSKASIEFSKLAIRGAFLLNGMGAVALLYSKKIEIHYLVHMIGWFAGGVLAVAIAGGAAYLAQVFFSESWLRYLFEPPITQGQETLAQNRGQCRANSIALCFRWFAIFLILLSYGCFGYGVYCGYNLLCE